MNFKQEYLTLVDSLLRRISSGLHVQGMKNDSENIGPMGGMILMLLSGRGGMAMHQITKELARDKAQLSRKINDLEAKGMIARCAVEDDARVCMISLTTAGEAYADLLRQWFSEVLHEIFAPLDSQEQNELFRILKKIHENY